MKLGIALAGGGAKGAAHVGILQAFEENGIKADMYAGTSAGSIVATAKALGFGNKFTMKMMSQINNSVLDIDYWGIIKDLPHRLRNVEALMKGDHLHGFLRTHFNLPIDSVKYPLAIVSTDIRTGQQVIFSSEDIKVDANMDDLIQVYSKSTDIYLMDILYASSAIPGTFPPFLYNDHKLVDGSIVNSLPANVIKAMGADKIIAIDLMGDKSSKEVNGILHLVTNSLAILINQNTDYSLRYAENYKYLDPNIQNMTIFDFNRMNEAYDQGYTFGKQVANEVYDFVYEDA